jgi:hypothetical protein
MNYFNDGDDDGSDFRDIPDEVTGQDAGIPQVRVNRPAPAPQPVQQQAEPEVEYEEEASEEEQEEDFASILSDARQRMEQGHIYEVLMDHDLFSGQGFDEKAVKYVTKQIRNFAKEQMEIMLGMRSEAPKSSAFLAENFPFNDAEVAALKDLAYVATKGATARDEAQTFTPQAAPVAPRRTGLNPIAVKQAPKPAARPSAPVAKPAAPKPLASKAAAPVKRDPKTEAAIERILQEEGITREEYERQYPPGYKPLPKPLNNMNEQELAEWKRQDALKTKAQVKSNFAIPMPSAEQEEMLHTQRANTAAANPQMQVLMAALTKRK